MSVSVRLSETRQTRAAEVARGEVVQGALDDLESLIAQDERVKVTALVEFIDEDLNVVIRLKGPGNLITTIRDAVAPELHLDSIDDDGSDPLSLPIPLSRLTDALP